jgi:hypothetical protein
MDSPVDPSDTDEALEHHRFANAVTLHLDALPAGSVLALQGSWGRGKTNVLKRVYATFQTRATNSGTPKPLQLDPWRYGTPDLIGPVVLALLKEIPKDKRDVDLERVAKSLLRAGNAMLFKALTVIAPAPVSGMIGAAEQPVSDLLSDLFHGEPDARLTSPDPDPVAVVADRFKELVELYLAKCHVGGGPLLVCVDDLDRCLPDHQIAMLEAIHFLTSSGAKCSFLIALDPMLVQQAAITHYGTEWFDSNKYLDKLFTLRLRLPELSGTSIKALLRSELTRQTTPVKTANPVTASSLESLLTRILGVTPDDVATVFSDVFSLPELKNPRLIRRACERIRLLALANVVRPDQRIVGSDRLTAVITWCAIADRWPEMRQMLQDTRSENWLANIRIVCFTYGFTKVFGQELTTTQVEAELKRYANVPERLPGQLRQPDLGTFLDYWILRRPKVLALLAEVDAVMVICGL